MLSKLSLLVLVIPLVSALVHIQTPADIISEGTGTITWTADSTNPDPTVTYATLELVSPIFNSKFAINNNILLSLGTLTFQFPSVPSSDNYTIQFVSLTDTNNVYGTSQTFAIVAGDSVSNTLTVTSSGTTSIPQIVSGSATSVATPTPTAPTPIGTASATDTDTSTGTGTGTGTDTDIVTGTVTGTAGTSTHSSAAVSSRFALTNVGSYAILLLSAVAGIAL